VQAESSDERTAKSVKEIEKIYKEKFASYTSSKGGNEQDSCDADDHDCNQDVPGKALKLIARLKETPYDHEALLEEAAFLSANSLRSKLEALLVYRHIINKNLTDKATWRTEIQLMDKVFDALNNNAKTHRLDRDSIIFKESREWLGKVATMKQPVKFDGQAITVTTSTKDVKQSVFLIENFLSEDERKRLIAIHNADVARGADVEEYVCDSTGGPYFNELVRKEKSEEDLRFIELRNRHYLSGFNCLRTKANHTWVNDLKYSIMTDYYLKDYQLIDQINARIDKLVTFVPHSGHGGTITTYEEGEGISNGTGCQTGAKWSPRKMNSASVTITLQEAEEGGEDNFFHYSTKGKTEVPVGAMLVVFHFHGQECDLKTTRRTEDVIKGKKIVYQRQYDNFEDPSLFHRATATPLPPSHPTDPRRPYAPVILCDRKSCHKYMNGDFSLQNVLNDQPVINPLDFKDGGRDSRDETTEEDWGY